MGEVAGGGGQGAEGGGGGHHGASSGASPPMPPQLMQFVSSQPEILACASSPADTGVYKRVRISACVCSCVRACWCVHVYMRRCGCGRACRLGLRLCARVCVRVWFAWMCCCEDTYRGCPPPGCGSLWSCTEACDSCSCSLHTYHALLMSQSIASACVPCCTVCCSLQPSQRLQPRTGRRVVMAGGVLHECPRLHCMRADVAHPRRRCGPGRGGGHL
jgi:hypothetical protein